MKGIVTRSTGSWYNVKCDDGAMMECRIKGVFRLEGYTTTNPIAVGDHVELVPEGNRATGMITEILHRKNCIIRQSPKNPIAVHLVAANVDLCLIVATISQPRTSFGFIDRIQMTAAAYEIPSIVVFNKLDIYSPKDFRKLEEYESVYHQAKIPFFKISALNKNDVDTIHGLLKNKVTLITGHSGVGKSTLINQLIPTLDLKTIEISQSTQKGMHATTFAEMFELPDGGFLIDTPGMKEFGILKMELWEVAHFFPEMLPHIGQCQFNNCVHINETKCGVKAAFERGEIPTQRYDSYLSIVADIQSKNKW